VGALVDGVVGATARALLTRTLALLGGALG